MQQSRLHRLLIADMQSGLGGSLGPVLVWR